jgi:hypothetical protein
MVALVGERNLEALERWIAFALAFEEGPIAALSLSGVSGAGKGMFCRGLIECLAVPDWATSRDLIRDKNPGMKNSPFLIVDEGLPRRLPGSLDIADAFRGITAGDPIYIDEKYRTPMFVRNPMRVVFTANNTDVVKQLAGRSLTQDDLQALTARILHFDIQPDAGSYLSSLGGMQYTAGWITPVAGGESDFILARHFLWLYETRDRFQRDARMLVEGNTEAAIIQEMRTADSVTEHVTLLAARILEGLPGQPASVRRGIALQGGEYLLTSSAILAAHEAMAIAPMKLNLTAIGRALKSITLAEDRKAVRARVTNVCNEDRNFRWWSLDLHLLQNFCYENSIPCNRLEQLMSDEQLDT